jgi:ABC-type transporter Mla subunit MlaD
MYGVGIFGLLVAAALFWIGYNAPNSIPGRSYYDVKVEFPDADNITSHDQVRIAGKLVGQVLDLHPNHGLGEMTLQLQTDVRPLLSDTTARVRPRSPVGVRFIQLTPGTKGTPIPENGLIPATQTSAATELDVALDTLNPVARAHAQTLLNGLGLGLAGRGGDIAATLGASPAALKNTQAVTAAIAARTGALARLIVYSDGAANGADPVRQTIATGFQPENLALQPFYVAANGLTQTLNQAPTDLSSTRGSLVQSNPFLVSLTALSRDALPALRAAPNAFSQASILLEQAQPSLRNLNGTVQLLNRAVDPTLGLLNTVNPVLPNLDTAFSSSTPILSNLAPRGCDIHLFAGNWESMLGYGEADGNYLRFLIFGGNPQNVGGIPAKSATENINDNPYPAPCTVGNGH